MSKSYAEKEALGHEILELCFKSELNSNDVRSIIRCVAEEADTNVRDKWGHTSLMYASRDGHAVIVHELLVRGGANPNLANRNDGWTSLMFASYRNHPSIVAKLLTHGADSTTVTSRWGYAAIDIARKEGHTDVVTLLEPHQRLCRSKTEVRLKADCVRPAEDWLLKLLKCARCGAVIARKDFPSHGIEVHAGDMDFDWKSSNVKSIIEYFAKTKPLGLIFFVVENCEDEQEIHPDFDEQHSATLQLQREYDSAVQKVESDDKLRQIQQEASMLMYTWPKEWFQRSKMVPQAVLDAETEEVLLARSLNAKSLARSMGSHLVRPLTPPDDS